MPSLRALIAKVRTSSRGEPGDVAKTASETSPKLVAGRMKVDFSLERFRLRTGPYGSNVGEPWGAFLDVPGPCGRELKIFTSIGDEGVPWEHVSVSLRNRCPNWQEMCFVKDLFWPEDEVVMQLHPAKKDYVNIHDFCLHLWKPLLETIPTPPIVAV